MSAKGGTVDTVGSNPKVVVFPKSPDEVQVLADKDSCPGWLVQALSVWDVCKPGTVFRALGVVEVDEDKKYVSFSPSLPGAVSRGDTPQEALANLEEALAGCIESYRSDGKDIPWVEVDDFRGEAVLVRWIDVRV